MVVLLREYDGDLGEAATRNYVGRMTLVLMMVVLAFGLLYVAVVAEERQMQEATKPRKRSFAKIFESDFTPDIHTALTASV